MNGFLSYSHDDHRFYTRFRPHLTVITRAFDLRIWTDQEIPVGTDWEAQIEAAIKAAQVLILLLSPNFFGSDYVVGTEIPAIKEREKTGGALVLPVVLTRCYWQAVQPLWVTPTENIRLKPVTDWRRQNDGFDCARDQMLTAIEGHFGIARKQIGWRTA
jgi:hypothetical protein